MSRSSTLCSVCGHQPGEFACQEADECDGKLFCSDCELDWHGLAERRGHWTRVHLPESSQLLWSCPHCTFTNEDVIAADCQRTSLCCSLCQADCAADVGIRGVWLTSQRAADALMREAELAAELQSVIRHQEACIAELTGRLETAQRRLSARPDPLQRSQSKKAGSEEQRSVLVDGRLKSGACRRASAPTGSVGLKRRSRRVSCSAAQRADKDLLG